VSQPRVEILSFAGCPNRERARGLVERIAAELGVEPTLEMVEVVDSDAADRLRFLGSPTVRVNGRDVEPGAEKRREFVFSCRVYRSDQGLTGHPSEASIREALTPPGS
jgi:hypothetical protein